MFLEFLALNTTCVFLCRMVGLFVCLFVCLFFVCLFVRLFVCLFVCLFVGCFVRPVQCVELLCRSCFTLMSKDSLNWSSNTFPRKRFLKGFQVLFHPKVKVGR